MEIQIKSNENETYEIFKATNKDKPKDEDIKALRVLFREKPQLWQEIGNLAGQVQESILRASVGNSFISNEALKKKLALMRDELGWNDSTEIEKILIEQVCLNWLRLNLLESLHHTKTTENHRSETGLYWDKRLDSVQKRYLRTCESLAKVRKLLAEANLKEQQARNKRQKSVDLANKLLKDLAT